MIDESLAEILGPQFAVHDPARFRRDSKPGRGMCSGNVCTGKPVVDRISTPLPYAFCDFHARQHIPERMARAFGFS